MTYDSPIITSILPPTQKHGNSKNTGRSRPGLPPPLQTHIGRNRGKIRSPFFTAQLSRAMQGAVEDFMGVFPNLEREVVRGGIKKWEKGGDTKMMATLLEMEDENEIQGGLGLLRQLDRELNLYPQG
ncbi:hypothetical protein CDAR_297121 [Caerostris darwini]|uniref:Uncharacterized protein n=1 Tax=Caerostris darwini TaxID=1538125 RepID=A0AAV4QBA0_9ARAC|nr:hypothetical protein CDAR_297121 [Caerostris darwini]